MIYELAPRAAADLDSIRLYYRSRDPRYGTELLRDLVETFARIAETPYSATQVRTRRRGHRGWTVHPYVIYYRVAGETVLIERVMHGHQRRPRLP